MLNKLLKLCFNNLFWLIIVRMLLYTFQTQKLKNLLQPKHEQHPFHIVHPSPWPFMTAFSTFFCLVSFVGYFNFWPIPTFVNYFSIFALLASISFWGWDVSDESSYGGYHTTAVQGNLKTGFILFIASEAMFFVGFFWGYLHFSLSSGLQISGTWPPAGINPVDPWGLPFLNTLVLLSSGISITWAHRALLAGDRTGSLQGLSLTVLLGLFFVSLQYLEYSTFTDFSINDTVYGSIFYLLTGFHGFHVILGGILLAICLFRHYNYHLWLDNHTSFELFAWYWHFVDIVWLFVFTLVYWWGS